LTLIGGVVGTSLAQVAERTQRQRLERMTAFQASILGTMQAQSLGPDARMADVLDMAAARIDVELRDDPVSRAELQRSFGTAYFALGRFDDARRMYEDAIEVVVSEQGPQSVESLTTRLALASTLNAQGDPKGAIAMYEPLLEDSRRELGRLSPHTLRTALLLAFALLDQRQAERALTIFERAAQDLDEGMVIGHDYANLPMMLVDGRARALSATGDIEGALAVYREAEVSIAARFGEDLPDLANIGFNHGMTLKAGRRFTEARPLLADALRVLRPHLGASHPMV
jgi:tetratricopeptide (TPR) repeat protein